MIFTIEGKIKGKCRPRFNGNFAYTPKGTVSYENWIKLSYQQQIDEKPFDDTKALRMDVTAYYAVPKSYSKKKKQQCLDGELKPAKKPDADNILKIIADSLNGLAYADDRQIVEMYIKKVYVPSLERVEVRVEVAK